ncbi:MAG TPA: hemolysin family protein [Tepidisphaeraceae bacterium]|jgi:CBS domain containing-hemolysin-like protein|nr:hemolysin family protein [Tepidisphaeraceae bacterium]
MAWLFLGVLAATALSLLFSTLTYSLRDYSRPRLIDYLERHRKSKWAERTFDRTGDLIFTTAVGRLVTNLCILIFVLHILVDLNWSPWPRYAMAVLITGIITLISSVALPHSLARHAAEAIIGFFVRFLHAWRAMLLPATRVMHLIDEVVVSATNATSNVDPETKKEEDIDQDILSVVQEGEKEGVVDEQEREMIESVIEFRNRSVVEIMTPRPAITAIEINATMDVVRQMLEESGHSRLPVYEGTIDHIVGILYARDLLKFLGAAEQPFSIRGVLRPPIYVPMTKPLRDLLSDFRLQKIHIAIVTDEYGGTAGLVTIEDVLEELVGEIADEHDEAEPAMLKRLGDTMAEADARIKLEEFNRMMGLKLPEDAGYETLGGYISTTTGRIPETGCVVTANGARFTILDAEPQRVNRVKIELLPQPAVEPSANS